MIGTLRGGVLGTSRTRALVFLCDMVLAAASVFLALFFRGGVLGVVSTATLLSGALLPFMGAAFASFLLVKPFRASWRHASTADLVVIAKAAGLTVLLYMPLSFITTRLTEVPRSFVILSGLLLAGLMAGIRLAFRIHQERSFTLNRRTMSAHQTPVLLVGAGFGADLFLRGIDGRDSGYFPVGIVTDALSVAGALRGVPILGGVAEIPAIVESFADAGDRPRKLVITELAASRDTLSDLIDTADRLGLGVARVPDVARLRPENGGGIELQPISVEDILGRAQVVLDERPVAALVNGRNVLVTGAGGSIGGEIVRQVAAFGPRSLCLLDASEFNLYSIDLEVAERWPALHREARLLDVRDAVAVRAVMAAKRPDIVFHAAALKHVPLVECNPVEGVRTNVMGTRNVADACLAQGVRAMVMISTDKAVNPTNVMGATKRVAEAYCQALALDQALHPDGTRFVVVRFGNVLGSTGSVVPLFQRQIAAGGPVTVTHPDIARYFMTIREAVQLVVHASAHGMAHADAAGRVFVLDMGKPIRIVDLARQMIRLAGLRPDTDIRVEFTGLRPGEKLAEELFHGAESVEPTALPRVLIASPRTLPLSVLQKDLDRLAAACQDFDGETVAAAIQFLVPEYATAEHAPVSEA